MSSYLNSHEEALRSRTRPRAGSYAPLHVFVVHKLEAPAQPELAMGAIASGGIRVLNGDVRRASGIPETTLDARTRRLGPQRPNTRRDRLSLGS
jgi:putative phosphoribosyl transferase